MEFYHTPRTCALATLITLFDVDAEFNVNRIDFGREDQLSPEFRAINPKARVPALVVGDTVLTETPAILAYLAQRFPEAGLFPADPMAFAQIQAFNSYLCSTLHVAHAHRMRGARWVDGESHIKAIQAKVPEAVGACWDYVENHAFEGPFVLGGTYTIADPYLFTLSRWMEGDGISPANFPKVAAHRKMMATRDNVVQALAIENAV